MQILNKKRVLIIPKTLKMQAGNIYLFNCIVKCYQNNVTSLLTKRPKYSIANYNENYLRMIYLYMKFCHIY